MTTFRIPSLVYKQRETEGSPEIAVFGAAARDIKKWAGIARREEGPPGAQRRLNPAKQRAVSRFLRLDPRNVISPAITVTLKVAPEKITPVDGARPEIRNMKIIEIEAGETPESKPGLIIDGQHRLFGIHDFNPDIVVNVVALLNVDDLETAFQFLVINNKVTRVSGDHIRTLALDYQAQANQLSERLKTARLSLSSNLPFVGIVDTDEDSPFRGQLTLEGPAAPGQRFVPPAAIEIAMSVIQAQEQKGIHQLSGEDSLCSFFYSIWSPIKAKWPELWLEGSKLMQKVSIIAVTQYMTDSLVAKYDMDQLDVSDPDAVETVVEQLLQRQKAELWTSAWTKPINDSVGMRNDIFGAMTLIARNVKADEPWHQSVGLVSV